MTINVCPRTETAPLRILDASRLAFEAGDSQLGFQHFQSAPTEYQNRVYEQLWIDRNRPMEIPEYGRRAFNDTGGLSSTLLEKAASIHHYIVAVVERRLDENDQNIVRYERRYNPYTRQYEHVSIIDWDRWANDMRTIIPHSDDPDWVCQAKTLGIGVGIVGTAIMICIGKIIFRG